MVIWRLKSHADLINGSIKQWVNTTSRLGYTTSLSFAKTTNRSNSVLDYMTTSGKGNHSDGVVVLAKDKDVEH